ncbi:YCF48-related protein [Catenovulum agarivorans]|uniref:YCF48-related protein n=1 Tax=Catenovulum agarivorans TaxID=1172192 RepID=UPI00031BB600|nr:YCF48-related protein [Catenovulum agarivorans]
MKVAAGPILLLDVVQHQNSLFAAAERGYIAKLDWQQSDKPLLIKTPTDVLLTAITTSTAGQLWAVGHEGVIVTSIDNGATWDLSYQHPAGGALFDINFFDDKQGIAIGAYGLFLRTQDGGLSWQQEYHASLLPIEDREYLNQIREQSEEDYLFELSSILPHLNQVKLVGDTLFVVGELGLLAASTDYGLSWQRLNISYQGSLYDVAAAEQDILIAGMRGNLYMIELASIREALIDNDLELAESKIDFPEPVNLNKVTCAQTSCLLLGNSQTVWKLDNQQVIELDKFKSKSFVSAIILNEKTAFLVGEKGYNKLRLAN